MSFDQWWHSITTSEQKFLGKNYAQYIWKTAQQAREKELAEAGRLKDEREDKYKDGQQLNLL